MTNSKESQERQFSDQSELVSLPDELIGELPEDVRDSSLVRLVVLIGLAQEPDGDSILSPALDRLSRDQESCHQLILTDPEFSTLATEVEESINSRFEPEKKMTIARQALSAYAQFLSDSEVNFGGRVFAATPLFRSYIKEAAKTAALGPYFQRVLEGIGGGNLEILRLVTKNLEIFFHFDEVQSRLQDRAITPTMPLDYAEHLNQASSRFQEITETILNLVFDSDDQSAWRKFVMKNFVIVCLPCSTDTLPEDYNPLPEYERMKRLFSAVESKDKDTSFLPDYFLFSIRTEEGVIKIFDEEILTGRMDGARAFVRFREKIHIGEVPSRLFPMDERSLDFWIYSFAHGFTSESDFLKVAANFRGLNRAFASLPPSVRMELRKRVSDPWAEFEQWQLLTGNPILQGETIISLVAGGLVPDERKIELLEKKSREDKRVLGRVVRFGRSLFSLTQNEAPVIEPIEHWVTKFLEGGIGEGDLEATSTYLKTLAQIGQELEQQETSPELKRALLFVLKDFYYSYLPPEESEALVALFSQGTAPTRRLRDHLKAGGKEKGLSDLTKLRKDIESGRFDHQNPVQKDLEYIRYLELSGEDLPNATYQKFEALPFVLDEERRPALTYSERLEAEVSAFEAARLYWFIRQKVEAGRKVVVVGNARYGEYFVVEPLKPYLDELGVRVNFFHVRSGESNRMEDIIPQSFSDYLLKESPDVVIVDGTAQPFDRAGIPRFPRAMTAYYRWFERFNGEKEPSYKFAHLLPVPATQVSLGQLRDYVSPSNESPEVIFASPVIDPERFPNFPENLKPHHPGFWDDPERHSSMKAEFALTLYGVKRLVQGRTEEETVELAQDQIRYALPEMIERTSPHPEF